MTAIKFCELRTLDDVYAANEISPASVTLDPTVALQSFKWAKLFTALRSSS